MEEARGQKDRRTAGLEIRWEPDMPVRQAQQEMRAAKHRDPWETETQEELDRGETYEAVEAAQPIAANLIEFPREIIATRRMRPRITEAFVDELNRSNSASSRLSRIRFRP